METETAPLPRVPSSWENGRADSELVLLALSLPVSILNPISFGGAFAVKDVQSVHELAGVRLGRAGAGPLGSGATERRDAAVAALVFRYLVNGAML